MSFGISDTSWKKAHAAMADKEYEAVCAYAVLFLKHLGNPPGICSCFACLCGFVTMICSIVKCCVLRVLL